MLMVGCVTAPDDGVRGLQTHIEDAGDYEPAWGEERDDTEVQRRTEQLLAEPLGMEQAVEVGVLNHPGVQADLRRIDVEEGRLRQQARIGDPEFEMEAYVSPPGVGVERWEPGVLFDVTGLFDRAAQVAAADAGVEAAQAEAAGQIVEFITDVRHRWVDHAAATEQLERAEALAEAAQALAEAARLHHEAGNLADDELRSIEADTTAAKLEVITARERATRTGYALHEVLGIDPDRQDWSVEAGLPELPQQPHRAGEQADEIRQRHLEANRLAQRGEQLDAQQRIERRRGWLPQLGVGAVAEIEPGAVEVGPALRMNLPLFDRRVRQRQALDAEIAQTEYQRREAVRAVELAIRDVDERLERTHRVAEKYQTELLPLRGQLVDETLRQYNAMTVSALELLEVKHKQLRAEYDEVDSRRAYWRAYVDYQGLVAGWR